VTVMTPHSEIRVGPHRLPNRAFLAPMAGITDLPFRRMAVRFGAGLVVSEMIASEQLADGKPEAALKAEGEGVGLHVVQLAGCEARWLAEGARIAEAAGADVIDINMGCPAKHVTSGQAGAALIARRRSGATPDRNDDRGREHSGYPENASRLGRAIHCRA
jgi:tRNA-dihydrouridine synthase B